MNDHQNSFNYSPKICTLLFLIACQIAWTGIWGQSLPVEIRALDNERRIWVMANGMAFTSLMFPDSLEKPILFPIYAPDQAPITRGFPIEPRPNEPVDHPHHTGLWFNYENVNGLDFWNNSYAIPPEKKKQYGWIKLDSIQETRSGSPASIIYSASWKDQSGKTLLKETTQYRFTAYPDMRFIDRITRLDAEQDVHFNDAKDGLLGLRVCHELELPSAQPKKFTDEKGNVTTVSANVGETVTGDYVTSEGKKGDSAWGTRGKWCMLKGKIGRDTVSIIILDHPGNPGYPTYWHARGYGLFAANPLGEEVFSHGKKKLHFVLQKGKAVIFRYRIIVTSGPKGLPENKIDALAREFSVIE